MIIDDQESKTSEQVSEELDFNDITLILENFKKTYRNVYVYKIEDNLFFYRTLTRKEYKQLVSNEDLSDEEKEEVVCEVCTLYPEKYDFSECDAGVPTSLAAAIMKNSFLDSIEHRKALTQHFREDMFDLQNQITCIINEAFPQFDIEEIEDWDMEKTAKYLSRAEWKLVNLRGAVIKFDPATEETAQPSADIPNNIPQEQKNNLKQKLTPEKIQQLRELQQKFPEINWFDDAVLNNGIEGIEKAGNVDIPALRPGGC